MASVVNLTRHWSDLYDARFVLVSSFLFKDDRISIGVFKACMSLSFIPCMVLHAQMNVLPHCNASQKNQDWTPIQFIFLVLVLKSCTFSHYERA